MVSNMLENERKDKPAYLLKDRPPSTAVDIDKDHEILILPMLTTQISGLSVLAAPLPLISKPIIQDMV